jgi:hypothetical protein
MKQTREAAIQFAQEKAVNKAKEKHRIIEENKKTALKEQMKVCCD